MADELPTPASRKELYLAKAAGMDVDELPKPASRIEEYLNAIAEGGGGGGGGYVLPTASADTLGGVKIGENLSIDANGILSALGGGGGGIKTLTSDDYNYPGNNPSSVALWLLPAGVYYVDNASSLTTTVKVHSSDTGLYYNCSFFEVTPLPQSSYILINVYGNFNSADGDGYYGFRQYNVDATGNEQGHVVYVNNTELAELKPNSINPGYYDYPSNNPDGVAIWNLNDGKYKVDATEDYPIKLYFETTTAMDVCWAELFVKTLIDGNKFINFEYLTYEQNTYSSEKGWCRVNTSTGSVIEMKMYTEESV